MKPDNWHEPTPTTDEELVPQFYSRHAILGFSIFFSPVFGAVLLMQNLAKVDNRKGRWQVLFFSLVYTVGVLLVINLLALRGSWVTYVLNVLGASWLLFYWWPKFIAPDLQYREKRIWKALGISVLIVLPFLWAVLYDAGVFN